MKPITFRFTAALLASLAAGLLAPRAHANGQARAQFENLSSAQAASQNRNPGVMSFNGFLTSSTSTPPQSNSHQLQEAVFGQSFSQWFPSDTFAEPILASVNTALYPVTTTGSTRTSIENSAKPFRYKWLLFEGTGTDVTAFDVDSLADFFVQTDRDAIAIQLAILKEAVAASPLDTDLRTALLDLYYDYAVAEIQAVKPKLAQLAKFRLGIEPVPSGKFIIDEEIDTYEEIVDGFMMAIAQYQELLSTPFSGIDPSSFEPSQPFGTPMGRYIFINEQIRRNTEPAEYANGDGVLEVPQPVLDGGGGPETPGTLFTGGYKDLNALLQLMGQRKQHLASLAKLRAIRKADGDVAMARESLAQAAGTEETDLQVLKSWFPELFPPDLGTLSQAERDAVRSRQIDSGVLASLSVIDAARIDLAKVTPFLNGSNNLLGFDPEFLLLVQDTANTNNPRESYDVLRDMLVGSNQPLTVALNKLNSTPGVSPPDGAKFLYQNFQEKVDRVATDIDEADDALANRFFAITGFEPDAIPGFDFNDRNPTSGSELGGALATMNALIAASEERKLLTVELNSQFTAGVDGAKDAGIATEALSVALAKEQALLTSGQRYKTATGNLYEEMITAKATQVGSQAAYDAYVNVANTPTETAIFTGGLAAIATGVLGAVNTGIQIHNEKIVGNRERDIDYAGIDFTLETEINDTSLVINQAQQVLSSIKREQIGNNLEILSDVAALGQAQAQQSALMAELARIVTMRDEDVSKIRKKSYASPLHYHRAEAALIAADEAFVPAQRLLFYTLQALNYKWHGKFAITQGSKTYDSSTIFKCRNADELNELLTQMVAWDAIRVTQTNSSPRIITRISLLDHILARNPNRHDPVNPSDPGTRVDDTLDPAPPLLPSVPKLQYFRKAMAAKYIKMVNSKQTLVIPFSTAFGNQIVDRVDGNFFRGASYDSDGDITDPGFWREKIEYVKVNIIAGTTAPVTPLSLSGNLTYGGTTYFHTRVPPRGDRTVAGLAADDAPGELLVAPFRYWVSPNFDLNFVPESEQTPSIAVAYNQSSAVVQVGHQITDNLGGSFQVNAFVGRSIAATGWKLSVPLINNNAFIVDVNTIEDIEIIIAYKHSDRVKPPSN